MLKEQFDVKYEFWPFYIIPNINMRVLSASLFVLLNECILARRSVHILMRCLFLAGLLHGSELLRLVGDWHLYSGLDRSYFCVK